MNGVLTRSLRAEMVRTGGRGPLWLVLLPAAALIPVAITILIACVAERFARIPGQQYVQQVPTTNAAYWVINVTVVLVAVAAAYGQASESRLRATEYVWLALPRRPSVLAGKWVFYGLLGAVLSLVLVALVLTALPRVAPLVYGQVLVIDPVGLRLMWTVPVYAFFAAGLGVGVGVAVRTPAAAVGLLLFWVYVVEIAVGYLPSGYSLQRFMPFLNGIYATGQDIVLEPPWGRDAALVYVCGVFGLVLLCSMGFRRGAEK
ncbi:ABC transporter permease [Mycolicibacterium smegmatis]|uniref:ABC transporter n=1 Tax=Mycolicibacterium smegmatis TaxID=1772 RepID=UPI0005D90AC6|nr:ABC transporter [Mycolicibacterium smegmatis]MDF1898351.1 ABC transporter permease [Mycolicibacterium smegmatis]MDF1906382.1 ABC transporter permease [Mycolicibacterium smegmatis]MDF1916466.1 ABC transporter permease [Mycolicibacterium smegmatis]MDF1922692.1 ABC transporter permease [Mycolicibacterium smegmatis]UAK56845.1 ABC transporter permease [Mycolicibacterium smegmatis]